MYVLFRAPWTEDGEFLDAGLAGIVRFTRRTWRLLTAPRTPGPGGVPMETLDRTVARVGRDLERFKFNTAVAALMELVRWLTRTAPRMSEAEWSRAAGTLVLLLAPFTPYLAEELWSRLGCGGSVHVQPWPAHDPAALADEVVTLVVQVDGRVRARLEAPSGLDEAAAVALALDADPVARLLDGRPPRQVVYVPDRLVNLVL
jgi:leucyl-tRNA synthetase